MAGVAGFEVRAAAAATVAVTGIVYAVVEVVITVVIVVAEAAKRTRSMRVEGMTGCEDKGTAFQST